MSTKLSSSPTPQNVATAIVNDIIAPAVRRMGGDTGIVTPKKAAEAKLSERQELARDNVQNFFELGDKKRISADKLIGAAFDYVKSQAEQVAGKDGRVSQADAHKLREDLKADFAFVRTGRLPPATLSPEAFVPVLERWEEYVFGLVTDDRKPVAKESLKGAAKAFAAKYPGSRTEVSSFTVDGVKFIGIFTSPVGETNEGKEISHRTAIFNATSGAKLGAAHAYDSPQFFWD